MEANTAINQISAEDARSYAKTQMVDLDRMSYEVTEDLVNMGLDREQATGITTELEDAIDSARKSKAKRDMLVGGLWCVGGTVVTVATYSAASAGGGSYMVAWGAIIFGAVQFIKGAVAMGQ